MHTAARSAIPILFLLAVLVPAPAAAQDWLIIPFLGGTFAGDSSFLFDLESGSSESASVVGASTAILGSGIFGVEADFGYVPGFFERGEQGITATGSYVTTLTGSALVTLPLSVTRESLRPYGVAGLGLFHADARDTESLFPIRSTMPGVVFGGGAIGFLSRTIGVRFDLRYLRSLGRGDAPIASDGPRLTFWRATVGLVLKY